MSVIFKHMFAGMNVINMRLNHCERVVFFNYNHKKKCIEMMHYKIQLANNLKGVSKEIKKIIKWRKSGYSGNER